MGDQHFVVDYFYATPGYKKTIAHNGALGQGVYARLHYMDDVILKVEVKNPWHEHPACPTDHCTGCLKQLTLSPNFLPA